MAVRKNAKKLLVSEYIQDKLGLSLSLYDIEVPIDKFIETLQSAKKKAEKLGYIDIRIEFEQDNYEQNYYLSITAKREETNLELSKRLEKQKKEKEAKKKAKTEKEEKERAEYKRLKQKFG